MSEPIGRDPLERLRLENPVDIERLPSASLARARARFQEDSVITDRSLSRPVTQRPRLILGAAAAAALAIALVALMGPRALGPGIVPSPSSGPISAACVETYNLDSLTRRTFAFDGTVASATGDEVTFEVNERFRGIDGDTITLSAPGMGGTVITSAGGPALVPGQRYLVAGDDRFVWACGFTQDYDPTVAEAWRSALSR